MIEHLDTLVTITIALIAFLYLEIRIGRLERDSHPPIDLTPAMVETLKALGVTCHRPPVGWHCSRPRDHHGPCAAYPVEYDQ